MLPGTGWSTSIPNYNAPDVIENIRRLLDGDEMNPMIPWYKGFRGSIDQVGENKFAVQGCIEKVNRVLGHSPRLVREAHVVSGLATTGLPGGIGNVTAGGFQNGKGGSSHLRRQSVRACPQSPARFRPAHKPKHKVQHLHSPRSNAGMRAQHWPPVWD